MADAGIIWDDEKQPDKGIIWDDTPAPSENLDKNAFLKRILYGETEGGPLQQRVNLNIEKPSDVPRAMLQGLQSVPDLVKTTLDTVTGKEPLGTNLDRYYKGDPSYIPGDITAEQVVKDLPVPKALEPLAQTAIKTGLDVGADPTFVGSLLSKAPEKVAEMASKEPSFGMKTAGKLGEFFTGGRMSPKWAKSSSAFSPLEQIRAGNTLDEANATYAPLKKAADDFMSGRLTPQAEETFKIVKRYSDAAKPGMVEAGTKLSSKQNPVFTNYDKAVELFEDAVNKVGRTEGSIPKNLETLFERIKKVQGRGVTAGPETAELMDTLNGIEYTGFGNPRLVRNILKGPQAALRGALSDLTEASSPAYSQARQKIADAITMSAPPTGGKMSKYVLQNIPTVAGGVRAADQLIEGDVEGAAQTAIATLLLRNPAAWNVASGIARIPAFAAKAGVSGLSSYFVNNPNSFQAVKTALTMLPKVNFTKTSEAIEEKIKEAPDLIKTLKDPQKLQSLGKFAPVIQSASQRGPAAMSAANHVLAQQSPEYREKIRQLNNQELNQEGIQ